MPDPSTPPVAKRIPHVHTLHNDVRPDDYHWLRERDNPEVIAYLEAENTYLGQAGPSKALQETLYQEMLARVKQDDQDVPAPWDGWLYYARTEEGQAYKIHCRKKDAPEAAEEIILNENALAEGHEFLSVPVMKLSPDHRWLAYSMDTDGSSRNTFFFKNLETREILPDRLEDTESYGSLEWAADSRTVFYVRMDAAHRPFELWRHALGTDASEDAMLYREDDETFRLSLYKTDSRAYLVLGSAAKITIEQRVLSSDQPESEWRVFAPRRRGVEYEVNHLPGADGGVFSVLTNEDALNFKLMAAPVTNSSEQNAKREGWNDLIPHRDDTKLDWVQVFEKHLVIYGRQDGLTRLWVRDLGTGQTRRLEFDEPAFTVSSAANLEFETRSFRFEYTSLVTPKTVYDLDLDTLEKRLLKREDVLGGYDPLSFKSQRVWATASDGTRVPISMVYRNDALEHGPAPLLLIGYGSYGIVAYEPEFAASRLALLERGVILAYAHVRGGGEMGRAWYEDGKLGKKRNTFTDFIACAEHLIEAGFTERAKLAALGVSAGGLLMGAITNLRPELFQAVIAKVPFVDVMSTMLDPSIPLTTLEYDEWGNPNDQEQYAYMRSYSPYDNLKATAYPHLLVTTGLNDPRVAYWEPAKWVAKLRTLKTDTNALFLHTNLGAGHGGSSGRFGRLRDTALEYAFVLEKLNVV
jgi:oligopeptidase B